jgi:hypothetical protein
VFPPGTKNVGWLGADREFARAEPSEAFLDALWALCKVSVAQMRGVHICEICGDRNACYAKRNGESLLLGTSEIRAFSANDDVFAAPTLVFHYVAQHQYAPPAEFVTSVLRGPVPPDRAYFERLEALGLEWNVTSAPSGPMKASVAVWIHRTLRARARFFDYRDDAALLEAYASFGKGFVGVYRNPAEVVPQELIVTGEALVLSQGSTSRKVPFAEIRAVVSPLDSTGHLRLELQDGSTLDVVVAGRDGASEDVHEFVRFLMQVTPRGEDAP